MTPADRTEATLSGLHTGGAWIITAPVERSHTSGVIVIDCSAEESQ